MKHVLLLSLLAHLLSCSGTGTKGASGPLGGTQQLLVDDGQGHLCQGNPPKFTNCQVKLGGMCASSSDCPPSINNCVNNRCTPATQTGGRVWFATDAIQPGVAYGAGNNYIYNIMAKGYASLDDWCMSQAQQSTLASMRNINSWTALIIAQPDNSANLGVLGLNRYNAFLSLINGSGTMFKNPGLTQAFSGSSNLIYDRNNTSGKNNIWTGIQRNFCQANSTNAGNVTNSSGSSCCDYTACSPCGPGGCQSVCASQFACSGPGTCGCYSSRPRQPDDNTCHCSGNLDTAYIKLSGDSLAINALDLGNNNNSWANSTSSGVGGVFILNPTNCDFGFDFASDCDGGANYAANGSSQKPILCLAN